MYFGSAPITMCTLSSPQACLVVAGLVDVSPSAPPLPDQLRTGPIGAGLHIKVAIPPLESTARASAQFFAKYRAKLTLPLSLYLKSPCLLAFLPLKTCDLVSEATIAAKALRCQQRQLSRYRYVMTHTAVYVGVFAIKSRED